MSTPATANPIRAKMFAETAHRSQLYADEVPHTYHLEWVVRVLERFGFTDPVMICAGWLHDVIEDTDRNYNSIKERFGVDVAELVYAVSNELGRNRDERNAKTYPKVRANPQALALKLADRIANVEYGIANGGGMLAKYKKEFGAFREALLFYMPPQPDDLDQKVTRMWTHLTQLMANP